MSARGGVTLAALAVLALAAGCAGRRIEQGVFHSPKGYRATVPGPDWTVVESSRADLELRHRGDDAGMFVNATCDAAAARRRPDALRSLLLLGLRDRKMLAREDVTVAGHATARALLEARAAPGEPPLRVETLTFVDGGCAVDLVYAARVEVFDARRPDFERFAASVVKE